MTTLRRVTLDVLKPHEPSILAFTERVAEVESADGVTISIYWNTAEVRGVNPGTVEGSESFKLVEFTV
mgnify:CR=1 FL=1